MKRRTSTMLIVLACIGLLTSVCLACLPPDVWIDDWLFYVGPGETVEITVEDFSGTDITDWDWTYNPYSQDVWMGNQDDTLGVYGESTIEFESDATGEYYVWAEATNSDSLTDSDYARVFVIDVAIDGSTTPSFMRYQDAAGMTIYYSLEPDTYTYRFCPELRITGSSGVVRTVSLPNDELGDLSYHWDGKDDIGEWVEPGEYTITVEMGVGWYCATTFSDSHTITVVSVVIDDCDDFIAYGGVDNATIDYTIEPDDLECDYVVDMIIQDSSPSPITVRTERLATSTGGLGGQQGIIWDGKDENEDPVAPGIYTAIIQIGVGPDYATTFSDSYAISVISVDVDENNSEAYMDFQSTNGADIYYTIEPSTLSFAYAVKMTIKDASSQTVRTEILDESPLGSNIVTWDGKVDGPYGPIPWAERGDYTACIEIGQAAGGTTISDSFMITFGPMMKLEKVGDTTIDATNHYSENTTIRVTAVRVSGETLQTFTGSVYITEDGTDVYSQNTAYGACLPESIAMSESDNGVVTFVAKSLADPLDSSTPPGAALIKTTFPNYPSRYPVFGGQSLIVYQWIDNGQLHQIANAGTYDWFETRTMDIFSNATGDAATVLSTTVVGSYDDDLTSYLGYVTLDHDAPSHMELNPYSHEVRLNICQTNPDWTCGESMGPDHSHTVLHEARHCYQDWLSEQGLGQPNDIAVPGTPNNDDDQDWLFDYVPIAPLSYVLDTTDSRQVCTGTFGTTYDAFQGDGTADAFADVTQALERDAEGFAARFYSSLP